MTARVSFADIKRVGIALGWVEVGDATEGNKLTIRLGVGRDGGTTVGRVRTKPFYDPAGERLRA